MTAALIRQARPDEANILSTLAFRSKAYWGYEEAFMAACRDDLTVTPRTLAERPYYLLEHEGHVAGFYNLLKTPGDVYLSNLFVAPENIGQGVGKRLWTHMLGEAKRLGYANILIESDPYAEAFYLARGAKRVGLAPSIAIPGRELPLLEFKIVAIN